MLAWALSGRAAVGIGSKEMALHLIAVGEVRVEIMLALEGADLLHHSAECQARFGRRDDARAVHGWKRPRNGEVEGRHCCVRARVESGARRGCRKKLRGRSDLHVQLEADSCLKIAICRKKVHLILLQ